MSEACHEFETSLAKTARTQLIVSASGPGLLRTGVLFFMILKELR